MIDKSNSIERRTQTIGSVDWRSIAFFYVLACAISWPFFWWRDVDRDAWVSWAVPEVVKGWAPATGPFIAALLTLFLFRRTHQRTVSLLGTSGPRSIAFCAVTVLTLVLIGIGDDEPHLTGVWFCVVFVTYALGEETGWRGFLHDALRPLGEGARSVIVGCLWGVWHFTTFLKGDVLQSLASLATMFPLWILASWGIGRAVETTRSLLVAAMLHLMFNFAVALPVRTALVVLAVSAPVWIYLIWRWPNNRSAIRT